MQVKSSVATAALAFAVAFGCTPSVRPARPFSQPPAQVASRTWPSGAPPWIYWEPIETPIVAARRSAPELPVAVAQLVSSPALETRWNGAPPAMRDAVVARGFAVNRGAHATSRLGEFYAALQGDQIPIVVTLDALFFLAHLALDRAIAEVEAHVFAPLLATTLHRLDAHMAVESRFASPDIAPAYVVARGLVEVALALSEPKYQPSAALARLVAEEKARVLAHAGIGLSPWFDMPIDYSAMAPVGVADRAKEHADWFRAVSWLENTSLVLEGAGERNARTSVDVATARVHARAALLLSRLLDPNVDAEAAGAWDRMERSCELLIGDPGDVTPREISGEALRTQLDFRNTGWLANVVRVDRVRHAVSHGRVGPLFRLLGPRDTPDGEVLQALTSPLVGGPGVVRALPSSLDVAAWLGSGEARAVLHESGSDSYEGYQDTLDRFRLARPEDTSLWSAARHRTPYLSMIDAIETWLLPSEGDAVQPGASTPEWRKRKAEVALAAWTELRHDATSLTRIALSGLRVPLRTAEETRAPVFVEPHPEAIAKLLGVVRQTARALVAEGALGNDSDALHVIEEVDDLLWSALGAAVYETADDALPASLVSKLTAFPTRLRALETAVGDSGAAEVPISVAVHVDSASGSALEEATGRIEEAWMVLREPGQQRLWLAIGASIPHHELVRPAALRLSDGVWRGRLQTEGDPAPSALARGYVF